MGSPEQSPSPIKNDGQIKGVECPLSPSPQVSSAIDNPLSDNETTSVIKEVGLKTVFESQESSETIISSCGNDTLEAETSLPVANEDIDEPLESVETAEQLDYNQKPAISYAGLIIQMTLADIYSAIMLKHHYYRHANSVRNSLSLNKAFVKVDRTPDEPGHGCFWALQSHVRDSNDPLPCRKRKAPVSEVATATTSNTPRPKGSVPQKPDRATETSMERLGSSHNPSFIDSAPSPAASEDAEDLKSLRRSGRVRRPPRPKEAEEYVSLHTRQPSTTNAPLSTPPSSPAPHNQDRELTPVSAPARKRASSVKIEKSQQVLLSLGSQDELNMVHLSTESKTSSITNSAPASSIRKGVQNVDLASIPGVVTTQRIRRPPQNLAEFVSSEDFKAAPCGKRQERTLQSSSSSLLNSSNVDTNARGERKEAKRSKSESHISFCNSAKKVIALEMSRSQLEQSPEHDDLDHNPSMTDISSSSQQSSSNNNNNNNSHTRPATIPLSALSHSKRGSRDFSCMNSKKQRRDSNGGSRSKSLYSKRHSSHETPTRQQILDRRRRDGKREIMVASEDDWSDSDFDFLRDEEENYRLMRIRVRKFQKACDRWDLRDEADDGHDLDEENDRSSDEERSRVEGEKIKLLMDPSVINYGFDSCDSEYILDYHQGPLFNNITWPEFSDVKDNTNGSSSTSSNTNNNIVNNTNNNNTAANCSGEVTECLDGDSMGSITTNVILTSGTISEEVDIDSQIVAEVISALTKSAILEEDPIHPTEHVTALQASTSTVPLALPTSYTANNGRKQEADEWAQFVGNCDPKIERNSGSNRRDEVGPEVELKDISKEHVQSTSNTTGVVTAIDHEIAVESSQSQMEDITIEETPVTRIKNEIEAEDFIGWSMCE
ncbi:transcription factor [Entomortierella beljakovae]|nr:transcription factor [Entomortierella beljakovae]